MKVGEIVAVTTTTLTAQSYELNRAPAFGSLLQVRGSSERTYYALCYGAQTGAIEPGRHAVAWGRGGDDEDGEDDIYRRQPQLGQVLRTTFDALVVGYDVHDASTSNGHRATGHTHDAPDRRPVQRVPATPPRLHATVYAAAPTEVARFNEDLTYLRFVLRAGLPNADDFIAATIDAAYQARGHDRAFLVAAARTVARLLEPEHERVMNILELLDG